MSPRAWREAGHLAHLPADKQEWLHNQMVGRVRQSVEYCRPAVGALLPRGLRRHHAGDDFARGGQVALTSTSNESLFDRCADLIQQADGLLISAGAGVGVDSGLPDFRGPKGFWGVYPALGRARLGFQDIANPDTFRDKPRLAWGFYGHRLNLYRETRPGYGFSVLNRIASAMKHGAYVFTSNVDGQFQKAGFSVLQVCEVHGSIHHLQCLECCTLDIWSASGFSPIVDEENCLLTNDLPVCPRCGAVARPNILMFYDGEWLPWRYVERRAELDLWKAAQSRGVVIEIGAGTAIPSVRAFSEHQGWPVIRINPTESNLDQAQGVSLPMGGSEALLGIKDALEQRGYFRLLPGRAAGENNEFDFERLSAVVDEERKAENEDPSDLGFRLASVTPCRPWPDFTPPDERPDHAGIDPPHRAAGQAQAALPVRYLWRHVVRYAKRPGVALGRSGQRGKRSFSESRQDAGGAGADIPFRPNRPHGARRWRTSGALAETSGGLLRGRVRLE